MSYRPQFKRFFRCIPLPSEGVILQTEKSPLLLRGQVYSLLAPLLDGQRSVENIVSDLHNQVPPVEVMYALQLLMQQGYVVDAAPSVPVAAAAFWDTLNINPQDANHRLQKRTIAVHTFGEIDGASFLTMLTSLGVQIDNNSEYSVILTDDYLHPGLEDFHQNALARELTWLLVKPTGIETWLGPLFVPGKTGCWACLAHRLRGARKIESFISEKIDSASIPPLPQATLPSTLFTALSLAATEVAKWIAGDQNKDVEGQIVTFNLLSLAKQRHTLIRRPQCPSCGDPNPFTASQSAPLVLQSRQKSFTHDGGHRSFTPDETWYVLQHHISPITGIVGGLYPTAPWVGETSFTPSFLSSHNFLHMPQEDSSDLTALQASLRSGSGGKGVHPTQAKVSALCEAIERYCGTFQGDEFRIRTRFKDLGTSAISPNDCMLYSVRQLAQRTQWNTRHSRSTWVPELFDTTQEVEWSPVWSLTRNVQRYLPTAYCYYGHARAHEAWFARADSNGCAAGRSKEEAILQGFMELVERDGVALWWYNRLQKPSVDLSSFAEPYFQELYAYYQSLRRDLWVLDLTTDLAIPTFAALSRRCDGAAEEIILGFGAHFDARLAVLRAVTEVNQWLPVVHSHEAEKDTLYRVQGDEAGQWWKNASLKNQPYLAPDKTVASQTYADYPQHWSDDLAVDVMACVDIAAARGLETLVLDQSRPDTELAVVKVIVPGLRHFWPRFGAGRLYNIPVQMGWLKEPLLEEQLNPQHIFF